MRANLSMLLAFSTGSCFFLVNGPSFASSAPRRGGGGGGGRRLLGAARSESALRRSRLPRSQAGRDDAGDEGTDGTHLAVAESEADMAVAERAYRCWAEQFPMIAARRSFYGGSRLNGDDINIDCTRTAVRERFLILAQSLGLPAAETLEIFQKDFWILLEEPDRIPTKVAALRQAADSEKEMLDFLRFAPKALGMTSLAEIEERGLGEMRARATLDQAYEALWFPAIFLFSQMRKLTAATMVSQAGEDQPCTEEELERFQKQGETTRGRLGAIVLGVSSAIMAYVVYADLAYGGPIHGKGLCPASFIPTYNVPDAEGNTRLPCSCAPLYSWYVEPLLSPEQKLGDEGKPRFQPAVESKNCGKYLAEGKKRDCDPLTVGGCVWTAEDLKRDPAYWDARGKTVYEFRAAGL